MTSSYTVSDVGGGNNSSCSFGVTEGQSASLWLKAVADRCLARLRTSGFSGLPVNGQDPAGCGGQTKPVDRLPPPRSESSSVTQEGEAQSTGRHAVALEALENLAQPVSQEKHSGQCVQQSRSALLAVGARGEPPRKKYCSGEGNLSLCFNEGSYNEGKRCRNLYELQPGRLCRGRAQACSIAESNTDAYDTGENRSVVPHEDLRRRRRDSTRAERAAPSIVDSWLSLHRRCDTDRCVTQIRDVKCGLSDVTLIYSEPQEATVILDDLEEMKRTLLKVPRACGAEKAATTVPCYQNWVLNSFYSARAQISLSRRLVPGRSVRGVVLFYSRFLDALVIRITAIERTARSQPSPPPLSGSQRVAASEAFRGPQDVPSICVPMNAPALEMRSVLLEGTGGNAFCENMQRLAAGPPSLITMVVLGPDSTLTTTTVSKIEGALVRGVILDAHEASDALVSLGRRGKQVFGSKVTASKQDSVTEREDPVHHCLRMRLLCDINCCSSDPSLVWGEAILKAFGAGSVVGFTFPKNIGCRVGRDYLRLPLGVLLSFRTLHFMSVRGAAVDKREAEAEDFARHGVTAFCLGSLLEKDSRMTNPAATLQRLLCVGLEACGPFCPTLAIDGCSIAALPAATLLLPSASLKHWDPPKTRDAEAQRDTEGAHPHMFSVLRCMTDRVSELLHLRRLPRPNKDQAPIRDRVAGACSVAWSNQLLFAAIVSVRQGSFAYAVEQCDAALSHYPQNGDALVVRGAAKANLKQYEEAVKDFDAALALNPDNVNAQRYRLKTVHRMGLSNRFATQGLASESQVKSKDSFDPNRTLPEKRQSSSLVPTSGFCFNWEDEEARLALYGQKQANDQKRTPRRPPP